MGSVPLIVRYRGLLLALLAAFATLTLLAVPTNAIVKDYRP